MIKITNLTGTVRLVTAGAFENIFKKQGWKKVEVEPEVFKEKEEFEDDSVDDEEEELTEDDFIDEETEELLEKPIAQMNVEELTAYAILKDINVEGLASKKELRAAIRKAEVEE